MAHPTLAAQIRDSKGKGAARKLRQDKLVPAVFYGPEAQAQMLTVDLAELERVLREATSENVILTLQIRSDGESQSRHAILKELQVDPVKQTYYHADFYEISMDKEITVDVPIQLVNTPVGVTNGGVLQHVRRELSISCLPDRMIDTIDLDVSGLDIGDSLHVRDITLPEGIRTDEDGDAAVALVAAPTGAREEAGEEAEGAAETPTEG